MDIHGSVRSELLRLQKHDALRFDLQDVSEDPALALYLASQLLNIGGTLVVVGSQDELARIAMLVREHMPWFESAEPGRFRLVADPLASL